LSHGFFFLEEFLPTSDYTTSAVTNIRLFPYTMFLSKSCSQGKDWAFRAVTLETYAGEKKGGARKKEAVY
jgi:hypothetical protein